MDFALSEEQQMLQDTVARFVQHEYGFEARQARRKAAPGWSRAIWAQLAELGLLGVPFATAHGGFGGSAVDTMLVMEQFGRGLVVEPYFAAVVVAGGAVALGGTEAQQQALLPPLIAGEMLLALAHGEPRSRHDLYRVETSAVRDGAGWVLNGAKSVVPFGADADTIIVSARSGGAVDAPDGIGLFLIPRQAAGVSVRGYATIDGMSAAELTLRDVHLGPESVLGQPGGGGAILAAATDRAVAALCGEAVGAMAALNEATLEYLKTRQQFGVPIGRFQALQHRMVDMTIQFEQARSMAILAAVKADDADARERLRAVSAAKVQIGRSGRFIGQQAIQLHGGMGMTDELRVGHYVKRLTAIEATAGDTDHHLARFSAEAL